MKNKFKYFLFLLSRSFYILRHIKHYGIADGWWMWQMENHMILDSTGEWLDIAVQQLTQTATKARWNENEEMANGIFEFIKDMKNFHKEYHTHLYKNIQND